jgi:hypothetical protein
MSDGTPTRNAGGFLIPALTAGIALMGGAAAGAAVAWVVKPPVPVEVPRDLTEAELDAACAPKVLAASATLDEANDKVSTLLASVHDKEAQVADLEAEIKKRGAAGADLKRKLEQVRAELASVKQELAAAVEEKKELVAEIERTVFKLERQKERTSEAREESLGNRWTAFVNGAQLQVCEKGSRKKLGKCREAVTSILGPAMRDAYAHCIRAGQEAPTLRLAEKGEELPRFARYLNEDEKIVRGWYIQFCDPTLPEAKFLEDDEDAFKRPPAKAAPAADPEALGSPRDEGLDALLEDLDK